MRSKQSSSCRAKRNNHTSNHCSRQLELESPSMVTTVVYSRCDRGRILRLQEHHSTGGGYSRVDTCVSGGVPRLSTSGLERALGKIMDPLPPSAFLSVLISGRFGRLHRLGWSAGYISQDFTTHNCDLQISNEVDCKISQLPKHGPTHHKLAACFTFLSSLVSWARQN